MTKTSSHFCKRCLFYWFFPLRNAVQVQFSAYYFYDSLHAPLRFHSLRSQEDTIFYTDLILISQFPRLFKEFYYHFQIEFEEGSNPHQWTLKTSDNSYDFSPFFNFDLFIILVHFCNLIHFWILVHFCNLIHFWILVHFLI